MLSSSETGGNATRAFRRTVGGAVLIVIQAMVIGFTANAVSPHRLPWIRIPLRDTHRMAASREALTVQPSRKVARNSVVAGPPVMAVPATRPDQPPAVTQPRAKPAAKPKKVQALFTTLPDAKALFDQKAAVFIDARHKEDYDQEHITGALSLFVEDLDKLYDDVLGAIPKGRAMITYCSDPQCETAIKLADALVARGHTCVYILLEGMPGWKDAGYPVTTGGAP